MSFKNLEELQSELLAKSCLNQISRFNRFGIFLKRLDFDIDHFINTLSTNLDENNHIRVGIFGVNKTEVKNENLEFSSNEEKINQWRNNKDNIPLIVFDDATAPLSQSIDSVLQPLEINIYREVIKEYLENIQPSNIGYINFSENICRLRDEITNNKLIHFLYNCFLSQNFEENLHILNLLIDKKLFSAQSFTDFKSLYKSHQNLISVSKRLDRKKKKVMKISKDMDGINFRELGDTAKNMILLDKNPKDISVIKKLEYDKVKKILNIKDVVQKTESIKNVIIDELVIREIISKNIKNDDEKDKQDEFKNRCNLLYELIKENNSIYDIIEDHSEHFIDLEKFKLVERGKKNRERFEQIYDFFDGEKNYGGVIDLSVSDETIFEKKLEQCKENTSLFTKLKIDHSNDESDPKASNFLKYLIYFVENNKDYFPNTNGFRDTVSKFIELREFFIEKREILFECPLFYIHFDNDIKNKIDTYIGYYNSISKVIDEYSQNINTDFVDTLKSNFLGFDTIFLLEDSSSNRSAYLYPFHPLTLWRWKKFSEVIISNQHEIQQLSSETNKKEELLDKIKNPYTTSSDLVLHKKLYNFEGETNYESFTPNYSLNSIPMYLSSNSTSVIETDINAIIKVISTLFKTSPTLQFGLKIFLINPPPYETLIKELNKLKNPINGLSIKIDIVVRHTKKRSDFYEIDKVKLDDEIELLNSSGGSFDEKIIPMPLNKIFSEVKNFEPHFTFLFSLQNYSTHFARNNIKPEINPFFLAKEYILDPGTQKITTSFAKDNHSFALFSEFAKNLMGRANTSGDANFAPEDVKLKEILNEISPFSLFCFSSEKVINDGIRLENSILIDKRSNQFSDLLTFTHINQKEIISEMLTNLFEEKNFYPSEEQLDDYLNIIQRLSTEFLASISYTKLQNKIAEKTEVSGIIGLLRVAKKYYDEISDSVLISLDDEKSNFWLKRAYDDKQVTRSDLLAIRIDSLGVPSLDIIEVKTSEDLPKAVKQVSATYNSLLKVLNNKDTNSFDNIRKQILQEQLIHTLIRQNFSDDKNKKLFDAIKEFFNKDKFNKEDFNLKIFFVKINPNIPSPTEIAKVSIDVLEKSADKYYLDVSSDTEVIDTTSKNNTIDSSNENKDITPINVTPYKPISPSENQNNDLTSSTANEQNTTIVGKYLIGKDMNTDKEVFWDTNDLINYSLLVTGDSGQGKTWTIKRVITQSIKNNASCLIMNVKGDDFDQDFAEQYNFKFHNVDDDGLPFNPFLPIARGRNYKPTRDIQEMQSTLQRTVALQPLQGQLFNKALTHVYQNCGIPKKPKISLEEFAMTHEPTLDLVYESLDYFAESEEFSTTSNYVDLLKNKLDIMKDIGIFQTTQTSFEDLINGRYILDIATLDERIINLILEIVISRTTNYMSSLPNIDKFNNLIVIDEAHRVKENSLLEGFIRVCRSAGFGIIFGTQLPKDLGPEIASQCASQISHLSSDFDNRKAAIRAITGENHGDIFNESMRQLQSFKNGQGYYKTNTRNNGISYKSVKFLPYKEG